MQIQKLIYYHNRTAFRLPFYHSILNRDCKFLTSSSHMDVRRIMIKSIKIYQQALDNEYRTHS